MLITFVNDLVRVSLESKLNTLIPFISTFFFIFPFIIYIKERFFSQILCYVCI